MRGAQLWEVHISSDQGDASLAEMRAPIFGPLPALEYVFVPSPYHQDKRCATGAAVNLLVQALDPEGMRCYT